MPDGFKIADGYVAVNAKIDRQAANRSADEAGQEAGDSFTRGVDGRLKGDKGRFTKGFTDTFGGAREPAGRGGDDSGRGFLDNFGKAFSGGFLNVITAGFKGGSLSSAFSSNPYVAGVGAALAGGIVAVALPAIGAGITAGLGLLSGLGVITAGVILTASRSPEVKAAAGELGKSIMGVDTAPLTDAYKLAQEHLTAANASGSASRIATAQHEVSETKKALDDAVAYNASHMTLPGMAAKSFTKPMLDSIEVLKGAWGQLAPSIGQAFETLAPSLKPLTEGFVGLVQNAMPGFLDFLKSSGPMLETLAKHMPEIGKALSIFFSALSDGGPGATKFLGDILTFLEGQIIMWGVLIGWLSMAYGAIHDFFAAIPGWLSSAGHWFEDTWHKVEAFFSGIWDSASKLPGKVGKAFSDMVTSAETTVSGWVDSVGAWFGRIGDKISDGVKSGVDRVGGWIDKLGAWFEALPDRVMTFLEALPGRLADWAGTLFDNVLYGIGFGIGSIVDFFIRLPGRVVEAVSFLGDLLSGWWTTLSTNVTMWVSSTVDSVVGFFTALPGRVSIAVSSLWTSISGWFSQTWTEATGWVSRTADDVVGFFTKLPGRASDAISSLWGSVSGWFTSTRDNANSTIRDAVNGAVDWLSGLPGRAWSAVSGLPGQIGRAVSGAGTWLWSAGGDVIRGLVDGIESMMSWAVDKARHAAHKIADGFKDALGINSPSTLMRDEVGAMLPPGAVEGFRDALPAAQRELAGMAPSLVQGVAPAVAVSATEGGGGRGLTIGNIEIKGVWDFTNPAAIRAMIAALHEALAAYQREYA